LLVETNFSCHYLFLDQTAVDAVSYIFSVKIDNHKALTHKAMFMRFSYELTDSPFPLGKGESSSGEIYKTERKNSPLLFQCKITIVHLSENNKKILLALAEKQKRPYPQSPKRQQAASVPSPSDLPTTSC
jgi:hypothetical protein